MELKMFNINIKMNHCLVFNEVVLDWSTTVVLHLYNNNNYNIQFYSKAAAPEMISINSLVITACLVRLNVKVSLPIISAEKIKYIL